MAPLIMTFAALLIFVMVLIKIVHSQVNKKHVLGLKNSQVSFFLNLSSYHWYVIRRVILISLCVLAIVWYLAFRYFPLFKDGTENGWLFGVGKMAGDRSQINYNKGWSMVLLLDLCTFMGIAMPIVVLFDRKDKITLACANLSILGSCMTFFGSYPTTIVPWNFNYLLFGTWTSTTDLPLSFMIHFSMLGFGLYSFLWRRRWHWKDWIKMSIISFGYLFYVLAVTNGMNITSQATALAVNDFVPILSDDHAVYGDVLQIFGLDGSQWKLAAFGIWSVFAALLIIVLPSFHWLIHRYTDLVKDNNYAQFYNIYNKNRFIRWTTDNKIYN